MHVRSLLAFFALVALLGLARPAQAAVYLGLGADWIEGGSNDFNLTLAADSYLVRNLALGGRAGVAFFDDANHVGIPIDLTLTIHIQRIYFAGLAGPWLFLEGSDHLHVHGAFGFGIESGNLALGLEVGKVARATLIGLRLTFRL